MIYVTGQCLFPELGTFSENIVLCCSVTGKKIIELKRKISDREYMGEIN